MLLHLDKDTAGHVASYLGGEARSRLRQSCRKLLNYPLLLYDGPHTTPQTIVILLPDRLRPFAYRTVNLFVYSSCDRPPAWTTRQEWLGKLAIDPSAPVQAFLCAFLKARPRVDTDLLLRDVSEDLQSHNQRQKLYCILYLADRPDGTTQDYILKMACLSACQSVVCYLVAEQCFDVTVGALTMALVSQNYSHRDRLQIIDYLLTHTRDEDITLHLNYWVLKYALFLNEWDVFLLLYRHTCENNVWTPQVDVELRHAIPNNHTLKATLKQTRASLYAPAQEIEEHVPLDGPADLPG
jgi:hypothetical protein